MLRTSIPYPRGAVFSGLTPPEVYLGDTASLGLVNASFTFEAWVMLTTHNPDVALVGTQSCNTSSSLHVVIRNQCPQFCFWSSDVASYTPLVSNQWNHLAFTYSSARREQRIYQNGVLTATEGNRAPLKGREALLLARQGHPDPSDCHGLGGFFTELRLWDHERTPVEVATLAAVAVGDYIRLQKSRIWGLRLVTEYGSAEDPLLPVIRIVDVVSHGVKLEASMIGNGTPRMEASKFTMFPLSRRRATVNGTILPRPLPSLPPPPSLTELPGFGAGGGRGVPVTHEMLEGAAGRMTSMGAPALCVSDFRARLQGMRAARVGCDVLIRTASSEQQGGGGGAAAGGGSAGAGKGGGDSGLAYHEYYAHSLVLALASEPLTALIFGAASAAPASTTTRSSLGRHLPASSSSPLQRALHGRAGGSDGGGAFDARNGGGAEDADLDPTPHPVSKVAARGGEGDAILRSVSSSSSSSARSGGSGASWSASGGGRDDDLPEKTEGELMDLPSTGPRHGAGRSEGGRSDAGTPPSTRRPQESQLPILSLSQQLDRGVSLSSNNSSASNDGGTGGCGVGGPLTARSSVADSPAVVSYSSPSIRTSSSSAAWSGGVASPGAGCGGAGGSARGAFLGNNSSGGGGGEGGRAVTPALEGVWGPLAAAYARAPHPQCPACASGLDVGVPAGIVHVLDLTRSFGLPATVAINATPAMRVILDFLYGDSLVTATRLKDVNVTSEL